MLHWHRDILLCKEVVISAVRTEWWNDLWVELSNYPQTRTVSAGGNAATLLKNKMQDGTAVLFPLIAWESGSQKTG